MLEIIIIIAVVKAFAKRASEKNFNRNLWGVIGAASYYLPILLVSLVILPYLMAEGIVEFESEVSLKLSTLFINLLVGILCCFAAYQLLGSMPANAPEFDPTILDEEL